MDKGQWLNSVSQRLWEEGTPVKDGHKTRKGARKYWCAKEGAVRIGGEGVKQQNKIPEKGQETQRLKSIIRFGWHEIVGDFTNRHLHNMVGQI